MGKHTILTINPGQTSTKTGVVKEGKVILDINVETPFDGSGTIDDQAPMREQKILDALTGAGIKSGSIDAISGRGVGIYSCAGGTYRINDLACDHAVRDVEGIHHAGCLGIVIAYRLGKRLDKPSFFVNPMNTDELCDEARMTGVKGLYRPAHAHVLNSKQVAIQHSELQGKRYSDCNYITVHMGSGISIMAHRHGKTIDSTRAGDGQAPIGATRTGDLCAGDVFTLLDRGMSLDHIKALVKRRGGLVELLGTYDAVKITGEMIPAGNRMAKIAWDAMEYGFVKWIATMAGALKGKVDAILLTGGMAYDENLVRRITGDCSWIAPIYVYPGSFETEALASGAERVLSGEEEAKTYTGKPVWSGFGFEAWEGETFRR
jgi:butyrate kinase